jgi:hypothetical protein
MNAAPPITTPAASTPAIQPSFLSRGGARLGLLSSRLRPESIEISPVDARSVVTGERRSCDGPAGIVTT